LPGKGAAISKHNAQESQGQDDAAAETAARLRWPNRIYKCRRGRSPEEDAEVVLTIMLMPCFSFIAFDLFLFLAGVPARMGQRAEDCREREP